MLKLMCQKIFKFTLEMFSYLDLFCDPSKYIIHHLKYNVSNWMENSVCQEKGLDNLKAFFLSFAWTLDKLLLHFCFSLPLL